MREIVREALRAGALGFASSKAPTHIGAGGKPVPSRLADYRTEILEICKVLG
jgi:N-acyl-D-aspartate/D-glutamate deacylase